MAETDAQTERQAEIDKRKAETMRKTVEGRAQAALHKAEAQKKSAEFKAQSMKHRVEHGRAMINAAQQKG